MVDKTDSTRTRLEAKELGCVSYFTGVPCRNGHIDRRYTHSGICYECRRLQAQRDYASHPDRWREEQTSPPVPRDEIIPGITRFGRLLVLQREASNASGNARWKCICSCDNVVTVVARNLRSGDTKSCGCAHHLRPYEHLYKRLLRRSEKHDIEVEIAYEEFLTFTKTKTCHYCDDPVEWTTHKHTKTTTSAYNLDRLRGNEGYVTGNLVVCCRDCNRSRGKFTPEEWKFLMAALKEYRATSPTRNRNGA